MKLSTSSSNWPEESGGAYGDAAAGPGSSPGAYARALYLGLLLIAAALALLRFVHLSADFPLDATWSGVLFTDEGWYANAAVRHYVTGQWYVDGDFNPIVNMPLGQLIHRAAFAIFGLGLFSARLSAALGFTAVIVLAALMVRRSYGNWAGLLTALILASNYQLFAFSRLAIMEPIGLALVMASLFVAERARGRSAEIKLVAASLLVVAAILAKGTMLFAVPLIVYLAWTNGETRRQRIVFPMICLLIPVVLVGGYQLVISQVFSADYLLFKQTNLLDRQVGSIAGWFVNILRKAFQTHEVGLVFLLVSALLILAAGVLCANSRRNRLVHLLVGYGVVYFGLLTLVNYGPPRYFLPLIVPLGALAAIACVELTSRLRESPRNGKTALLPSALIALVVLTGGVRIVAYMADPSYSFRQMARGVGEIIRQREGDLSKVVVFGSISDSIAIETGFRSKNSVLSTAPLAERLKAEHPGYLIVHVQAEEVLSAVRAAGGTVKELGAWDVYENYYTPDRGRKARSISYTLGLKREPQDTKADDKVWKVRLLGLDFQSADGQEYNRNGNTQ